MRNGNKGERRKGVEVKEGGVGTVKGRERKEC